MKLRWCHDISQIPSDRWQALVTDRTSPFLEWEWLYCLEASGSAKPNTGWMPCHLLLEVDGQLVAAAPMYLKGHSYGEFVFDQEWARVAQQLGEDYYPKLLGMAPFTPCTGYRFLVHPEVDESEILPAMLEEIDRFCDRQDISVCSFLYVDPDWYSTLDECGFTPPHHPQLPMAQPRLRRLSRVSTAVQRQSAPQYQAGAQGDGKSGHRHHVLCRR